MKVPPTGCERDPFDYEEASRIAEERAADQERAYRFYEVTQADLDALRNAPDGQWIVVHDGEWHVIALEGPDD